MFGLTNPLSTSPAGSLLNPIDALANASLLWLDSNISIKRSISFKNPS
jgi:hypothetical protein